MCGARSGGTERAKCPRLQPGRARERARSQLKQQGLNGPRGKQAGRPRVGHVPKQLRAGVAGSARDGNRRRGRSASTNAAIFGSIFVVIATLGSAGSSSREGNLPTQPASQSLVKAVTRIPLSMFAKTGQPSPAVSDQGVFVPLPSSAERPTVAASPRLCTWAPSTAPSARRSGGYSRSPCLGSVTSRGWRRPRPALTTRTPTPAR